MRSIRSFLYIPCPDEGIENMRFIVKVESSTPASFQGYPYVPLTAAPFPLLCVMHLPVFLSFSLSLLVSCEVSGVEKLVRWFLKSAKLCMSNYTCPRYPFVWIETELIFSQPRHVHNATQFYRLPHC